MTRLEENTIIINESIKNAKNKPTGTYEEMVTFNLGTIATMLTDISRSLAIIADKTESEKKKGIVCQGVEVVKMESEDRNDT